MKTNVSWLAVACATVMLAGVGGEDFSRVRSSKKTDSFDGWAMEGSWKDYGKGSSKDGKGSGPTCPGKACQPDCDALTECKWPGFDKDNLGDGFCDTSGCYNHKICGFDKGDCCESTCVDGKEYHCGDNGYECKIRPKQCKNKKVRIYQFCVDGNPNDEGLAEYWFAINGDLHFPARSDGIVFDSNQCKDFGDEPEFVKIAQDEAFKSLTVGVTGRPKRQDTGASAIVAPRADNFIGQPLSTVEWYDPTCDPYEVRISRPFNPAKERTTCKNFKWDSYEGYDDTYKYGGSKTQFWDAFIEGTYFGGVFGGGVGRGGFGGYYEGGSETFGESFGAERERYWKDVYNYFGGSSYGGGKDTCSSWQSPEESYTWFLEVLPDDSE